MNRSSQTSDRRERACKGACAGCAVWHRVGRCESDGRGFSCALRGAPLRKGLEAPLPALRLRRWPATRPVPAGRRSPPRVEAHPGERSGKKPKRARQCAVLHAHAPRTPPRVHASPTMHARNTAHKTNSRCNIHTVVMRVCNATFTMFYGHMC